jgi:hypothetical protein
MDKQEAIMTIKEGLADRWNSYRNQNPDWVPDLSDEDFGNVDLSRFNLSGANLCGSNLSQASFESIEKRPSGVIRTYPCDLRGARYCSTTKFPENFNPVEAGATWIPSPNRRTEGVIHFIGDKLSSKLRILEELFDDLNGEICICDPYYGEGTLDRFEHLKQCKPFRFLTSNPAANGGRQMNQLLLKWMSENNIEAKRHNDGEIHDRYILTKNRLILIGHGLQDIGTKESFVMIVEASTMPQLIHSVKESFEKKWQNAKSIR